MTTPSPVRGTFFQDRSENNMTAEHLLGVVEGVAMTHGVFHADRHGPCTIQYSCNSGLTYLDLYYPSWTTSSPVRDTILKLDQKSRMTAECVLGVVGGETMTCGLFHVR